MIEEEIQKCKKCGKKLGFLDKINPNAKAKGYCLKCFKEVKKHCQKCGKELGFWNFEQDFAQTHDFMCQNCWNIYATPEQKAKLPSTFSVEDFIAGKEIVVIITEGDADFQLTMSNAEKHGYELINMTQSQDNWSFLETKRTLIFKKKK
jgi:hypothetical protein